MNFLFWLFLAGLIIAFAQDVKRREVDNWLNLFLLVSGSIYFIFNNLNVESIFLLISFILFFFVLSNLFYLGRFFAGGDAKLLFAMTPFFISSSLSLSLLNVGLFIFCLFLAGSIYGIVYSAILGFIHFDKMKAALIKESRQLKLKYCLIFSFFLALLGFVNILFLILAIFFLTFSLLLIYAKALEKVAMYRKVRSKDLREGDWLVKDLKIGDRIFKANFEGLSKKDIAFIGRKNRAVLIKDGLPFVPAFLLAFLVYSYFQNYLLNFLLNFF